MRSESYFTLVYIIKYNNNIAARTEVYAILFKDKNSSTLVYEIGDIFVWLEHGTMDAINLNVHHEEDQ